MEAQSYPLVRGESSRPLVARAVLRDFGGGMVEVTAGFIRRDPSEVELHNAFLASVGSDERLLPPRPMPGHEERPPREAGESDADRVARRARQRVRHCCKAIQADRLLTLTTREKINDFTYSKQLFAAWVRRVRTVYKGFRYVAVPELHTGGGVNDGGIHWHVAVSGWFDIVLLRNLWYRTLGVRVPARLARDSVRLGDQAPGNIDMKRSRKSKSGRWGVDRLAGYIAKYVSKTLGAPEVRIKWARGYLIPKGIVFRVQRWYIRGEGYSAMADEFFGILNESGGGRPFVWQAPDRSYLWGSAPGA